MAEQQYTTPEAYKQGLQYLLDESRKLYEAQRGAGYQPYQGPRIATFAPEELAAMRGITGMVGAGQRYFAPAEALTYGQTQQFGDVAQQYMSPYQQAVIDVEKREAIRQAQRPRQDIGAAAVGVGGFGGSRQAILEAEQQRNLQRQLGDIQTRGQQAAYETGLRAFEAQKERERAAASGLAALGQAAPQQALRELTALSGVGEAQRGLTQAGMDIGFQEFQKQRDFPYTALGQYQSTLYGYPFQAYSRFDPTPKPSGLQNLAGILGAGAKIGSAFGFFKEGGQVSRGGLSGVVQKLAEGMTVGNNKSVPVDSPLGKDIKAAQMLQKILSGQEQYQKALEEYATESGEVMKERQSLAEKRSKELEKEKSPMNYLADLLVGYSAADPEAGLGAQLGGAAEYASEKREALESEIRQIQNDLLSGKISQKEANLKLQAAQLETQGDLFKALGYDDTGDTEIDATTYNALARQAAARTGVLWNPDTQSYEGSEQQAEEASRLLLDAISGFEKGGFKGATEIIARGVSSNNNVVEDTSVSETTSSKPSVSDDDIAGKISAFGDQSAALSQLPKG